MGRKQWTENQQEPVLGIVFLSVRFPFFQAKYKEMSLAQDFCTVTYSYIQLTVYQLLSNHLFVTA